MLDVNLRALSDGESPVSTRIIVVNNGPPIPCVVVRFKPEEPSFSELFSRIEGVRLEIIHADCGGFFLSLESNEFELGYLATSEEGQQFIEYLRGRDKEWVLVALAQDAAMIFMDRNGLARGLLTIPRDAFVKTVI